MESGQKKLILTANDKKLEALSKPTEASAFRLWVLAGVQIVLRTVTSTDSQGM